jgi:Putative beta-barrel porin 2
MLIKVGFQGGVGIQKAARICFAITAFGPSLLQMANAQDAERPLSFFAKQTFSSDSNVLQRPSGATAPANLGGGGLGDQIYGTNLGVAYRNVFGQQNVNLSADIGKTTYSKFSSFSRTNYRLSGQLNGDLNPAVYASVGLSSNRVGTTIANQFGLSPNANTSHQLTGSMGYRFDPTWSIFAGLDETRIDNSSTALSAADTKNSGRETGLRYQPQSGLDASIVLRQTSVRYPNSQSLDLFGNVLSTQINNGFKSSQALFRVNYRPTGISSVSSEIGYSTLDFKNLSERNSSNLIFKLDYAYQFSDALSFTVAGNRGNSVPSSAFASPILSTGLSLSSNWQVTGRTSFRANVDYGQRDFRDDAGVSLGLTPARKDNITSIGVAANYELLRNLKASVGASRFSRSSNIAAFSSSGHVVTLGLDLAIR